MNQSKKEKSKVFEVDFYIGMLKTTGYDKAKEIEKEIKTIS